MSAMTRAMGATRCALRASRAVSRGSAGTAAGRSSENAGCGVVGGARAVMKTRSRDAGVVVRSIVSEREDEIEARSRREARESVVSGSSDDEPEAGAKTSAAEKEYDIFRDSLLRYMGYANECGEAFVAWLPAWGVPATYGVAATYVLADTVDKGVKRWNKAEGEPDRLNQAAAVATETVTWQMLASVFWPGSFIRVVVASTNLALAKADVSAFDAVAAQGLDIERILPTVMGLAAIPFIVKPIDTTVDAAAEVSFAKAVHGEMKSGQEWAVGAGVMAACLAVPPTLFALADVISDAAA